jgi:siderophore synthetase component
MMKDGFAFEAHPQNTLARFSAEYPHNLIGFYIRDFGGLKVHLPTLEQNSGHKFEGDEEWVKSDHSVLSHDLESVYARMYHTIVHNHLQVRFCFANRCIHTELCAIATHESTRVAS